MLATVGVTATLPLLVHSAIQLTPRVKSFELGAPDNGPLPAFTAGSHIDVRLPNGLERSYSLLNDPRERDRYVIAVLREEQTRGGSIWMHEMLRPGTTIKATPPTNRFEVDEGGDSNLLVAGGIGITPLLAIASHFDALSLPFQLFYCTRSRAEAAFADEIAGRFGDRVQFHHSDGTGRGRLDVAALLRDREPGAHVYVCGPSSLIAATREAAREWPFGTVHFELFGAASRDDEAPKLAFDVRLKHRAKTLHVPPEATLLEALESAAVVVRAVCREGYCGSCTIRHLEGTVDHRDSVLDENQRANLLQACVSRGVPGETLVLDL
jgi:ferredoxin-NADP reductase